MTGYLISFSLCDADALIHFPFLISHGKASIVQDCLFEWWVFILGIISLEVEQVVCIQGTFELLLNTCMHTEDIKTMK